MDLTLDLCDGTTPYVAIIMATYGVSPSQTPKVVSAYPMGFPLFKVDVWANSHEFHSGPLDAVGHRVLKRSLLLVCDGMTDSEAHHSAKPP